MRLDLTSFMFGVELKGGAGTPAWGTALGQGAEKKLNPQSDNFYAGLIYSAIEDVSNVKCPLGKGGAVVEGGQPNDKFSIDLASKFTKIYVNGKRINGAMFILLVTKEKESVHAGRRTLKYNIKITYNENKINEECVNKMISALDLNENSAWLVYDIDIINQDELHFSVLVIDKNGKKVYENSDERKKDFERLLSENNIEINNELDSNTNQFKRNRIVFGAPGTGKSFKLNTEKDQLVQSEEQYERVTFHPDYTYANFVGTYKPVMVNDNDNEKSSDISYEYVPGPFMRLFVKAKEHTDTPYLLLIEEINRANVAAVFGDLFQLLDRDDNEESMYPVEASEDIKKFLSKSGIELENNKIKIPNNLFIWATMNSADQGVFPMDTAFKRRWDFDYISINNNEESIKNKEFKIDIENKNGKVIGSPLNWNLIRKSINKYLSENKINEDKQLGAYFISKKILNSNNNKDFIDTFKNKVLMYLFEDAAKQKRTDIFAGASSKGYDSNRYSSICECFDEYGIECFNTSIQKDYIEKIAEKGYN